MPYNLYFYNPSDCFSYLASIFVTLVSATRSFLDLLIKRNMISTITMSVLPNMTLKHVK